MKRKPPTAMQRKPSALELHAAAQAATHRGRELPDPLWPGHILEEVKATEPDCAAYRADKLRREAVKAPLHYGANLTERDVAARRERADMIADRGLMLAVVGLAVGAGGLIVFVRDLMTAMGVR